MLALLVSLVLVVLMLAFAYWIITLLPIPQPFKNIVIALVSLLIVISYLGGGGHVYVHSHWGR